ncbi:hypothetical protein GUJ93_ZPchr0008g12804 [Zizania palustris]|uniref:IAA-alanine resistance protein 1 n=1 Tax=Zizania palustris TaxID=103762 RepID=A0A8J5RKM8_ZIZPA|nr:hypothetical protein GUJ93_ZPchr0008g12804 [Zizania palustris]
MLGSVALTEAAVDGGSSAADAQVSMADTPSTVAASSAVAISFVGLPSPGATAAAYLARSGGGGLPSHNITPDSSEHVNSESGLTSDKALSSEDSSVLNSNIVFGYLNLFSDGVHNFTDGMALGSAFLLHGSVGGWSRTLFLLAHELPQEVGDFGILVRSGFTVPKALFFNFLSALVALAGTALALSLRKDPGHSSLIEVCCLLLNCCLWSTKHKHINIQPYYLIEVYPSLLSFIGNIFYTTHSC